MSASTPSLATVKDVSCTLVNSCKLYKVGPYIEPGGINEPAGSCFFFKPD